MRGSLFPVNPHYRKNTTKPKIESLYNVLKGSDNASDAVTKIQKHVASLDLANYTKQNYGEYLVNTLQMDEWEFNAQGVLNVPFAYKDAGVNKLYTKMITKNNAYVFDITQELISILLTRADTLYSDTEFQKFFLTASSFRVMTRTEYEKFPEKGTSTSTETQRKKQVQEEKRNKEYLVIGGRLSTNAPIVSEQLFGGTDALEKMKAVQEDYYKKGSIGTPSSQQTLITLSDKYASTVLGFVQRCMYAFLSKQMGIGLQYLDKVTFWKNLLPLNRLFFSLEDLIYFKYWCVNKSDDLLNSNVPSKKGTIEKSAYWNGWTATLTQIKSEDASNPYPDDQLFYIWAESIRTSQLATAFIKSLPTGTARHALTMTPSSITIHDLLKSSSTSSSERPLGSSLFGDTPSFSSSTQVASMNTNNTRWFNEVLSFITLNIKNNSLPLNGRLMFCHYIECILYIYGQTLSAQQKELLQKVKKYCEESLKISNF